MKTNNNFHILIVDDEPLNLEMAAIYLKEEHYRVSTAQNAQAALKLLTLAHIDLILLDIDMPQTDGFTLAKMLKSEQKTKDIPIIFLTSHTDISYIQRAFETGGADYITKPFNASELKVRVHTQLKALDSIREIKNKQSKLAQLSVTDHLTKLHNELYFDAQIRQFQHKEEMFWIVYIKINQLDKINKLYGYAATNKLLRAFAKSLNKTIYKNMVAARLFGANFAILSKNYKKSDIEKLYKTFFQEVKNNKLLDNAKVSTVIYNVEPQTPLNSIYKNLFNKLDSMKEKNQQVTFL